MQDKKKGGRPPIHDQPMERHVILLTSEQWAHVRAHGGTGYLRDLVVAAMKKAGRPRKDARGQTRETRK